MFCPTSGYIGTGNNITVIGYNLTLGSVVIITLLPYSLFNVCEFLITNIAIIIYCPTRRCTGDGISADSSYVAIPENPLRYRPGDL